MPARDIATRYLQWTFLRAVLHRGWWLVTSLYLVSVADLSAFQLVFLGTAQNLTALVFEVPTGVLADTISRKWSVVFAHLLMGAGMVATGLVTSFPALVATQMLWGLSWTFSSGADVAWLSDELDAPERVAGVLTASARWEQVGAAAGLIGFGAVAWATDLSTSIVVSGTAMIALGLFVAIGFSERHFVPTREDRWRVSISIVRRGMELSRRDPEIMLVFVATLLVNGAAEAFDRLFPKRLLELGFSSPPDPIVWLTALGLVSLVVGALALRIVESRIDGVGVERRIYALACFVGAFGLILLSFAPNEATGMAGVILVGGIAWTVTRCVSVIWINRRATSDIRATLQSFLAQVEYCGEILLGITLALVAQATSIAVAMFGGAALVSSAGVLVLRSHLRQQREAPGDRQGGES